MDFFPIRPIMETSLQWSDICSVWPSPPKTSDSPEYPKLVGAGECSGNEREEGVVMHSYHILS